MDAVDILPTQKMLGEILGTVHYPLQSGQCQLAHACVCQSSTHSREDRNSNNCQINALQKLVFGHFYAGPAADEAACRNLSAPDLSSMTARVTPSTQGLLIMCRSSVYERTHSKSFILRGGSVRMYFPYVPLGVHCAAIGDRDAASMQ